MIVPTRDRSQPLTVPAPVGQRAPEYCAYCGAPVGASHMAKAEQYGRYRYCNADCHKAGRRANAAENRKRRVLRAVQEVPAALKAVSAPACLQCEETRAEQFSADRSRKSGKANLCKSCERKKFAAYYAANKARIKARSKDVNRRVRASAPTPVPAGVTLSPRQLRRTQENLTAIVAELPEAAPTILLRALSEGRVNGAVFEDRGGCGCLWGTLGRAFGWSIPEEGRWASRFRQRWCAEVDLFGRIAPGDTPSTNPYAAVCRDVLIRAVRGEERREIETDDE